VRRQRGSTPRGEKGSDGSEMGERKTASRRRGLTPRSSSALTAAGNVTGMPDEVWEVVRRLEDEGRHEDASELAAAALMRQFEKVDVHAKTGAISPVSERGVSNARPTPPSAVPNGGATGPQLAAKREAGAKEPASAAGAALEKEPRGDAQGDEPQRRGEVQAEALSKAADATAAQNRAAAQRDAALALAEQKAAAERAAEKAAAEREKALRKEMKEREAAMRQEMKERRLSLQGPSSVTRPAAVTTEAAPAATTTSVIATSADVGVAAGTTLEAAEPAMEKQAEPADQSGEGAPTAAVSLEVTTVQEEAAGDEDRTPGTASSSGRAAVVESPSIRLPPLTPQHESYAGFASVAAAVAKDLPSGEWRGHWKSALESNGETRPVMLEINVECTAAGTGTIAGLAQRASNDGDGIVHLIGDFTNGRLKLEHGSRLLGKIVYTGTYHRGKMAGNWKGGEHTGGSFFAAYKDRTPLGATI